MSSFLSETELNEIGFAGLGTNIKISRKVSIYSPEKIVIGNSVRIDDFCILSGKIEIGNYVHLAAYVALFAGCKGIYVKDFVGISSKCVVYAQSDDYSGDYLSNPTINEKYRNVVGGSVIINKHSLIGSSCVVLPNLSIGEGASVGAMSLVIKSIDPWWIHVGIPVKAIKPRSKKLLELEKEFLTNGS